MGGDDEIDGVGLVSVGELFAEVGDGFGIAEELPSAENGGEVVELGDGFGESVDGGGDWIAGIEHGIEVGDRVLILGEGVDDGVEDELAAAASYEPVVGECDFEGGSQWRSGLGGVVYHVGRQNLLRAETRCWRRIA